MVVPQWGKSLSWGSHNSHFTMVYGRYNELVNGVYKPTNITGGHHPVCSYLDWSWMVWKVVWSIRIFFLWCFNGFRYFFGIFEDLEPLQVSNNGQWLVGSVFRNPILVGGLDDFFIFHILGIKINCLLNQTTHHILTIWTIVWWFGIICDNPSHWLSYFSKWLKPPTSIDIQGSSATWVSAKF